MATFSAIVSPGASHERPTDAFAARCQTASGAASRSAARTAEPSSMSRSARDGAVAPGRRSSRCRPANPAPPVTKARPFTAPRRSGASLSRATGFKLPLAQPLDGYGDALAQADLRLPPEQPLGLLDRGPAPLHVDLERGQMLELEHLGVLPAGLPDDARDLRHGELLGGGHVEVLVLCGWMSHRGHDPGGYVVHVREGPSLLPGAE